MWLTIFELFELCLLYPHMNDINVSNPTLKDGIKVCDWKQAP